MKHLKGFNENLGDDDFDGLEDRIKNSIDESINFISPDLEEYTTNISGEFSSSDEISTDFGDYKYEIKITRIG